MYPRRNLIRGRGGKGGKLKGVIRQ